MTTAVGPSSSTSAWTATTTTARNPVALRLYKVLGTNFDDEATREGLLTISELYSSPTSSGEPASSRARRNLKRDMETKLAEGSYQFLQVFGELDGKLDQLQNHLNGMRASCDDAEKQLDTAYTSSSDLLERAGRLQDERQTLGNKKTIITLFLRRFTLTNEEETMITSREVPVGLAFFQVLDKIERIQSDCTALMDGEDGPSKAGLEIMNQTSEYLEHGYDKILRWCITEFRARMGKDVHVEVDDIMVESIKKLRRRPELLTEALTTLSQTRQTALLSSFLAALTRGGPSGLPRPIELHAHDPMRYVGDMLAWVHQTIAAEREFLESLFGIKEGGGRMVGEVRKKGVGEEEEWISELMDLGVGRLCPPLKLRVQQTVKSQESSITSYKIANLLQFYLTTMKRTVGDDALLSTALKELTDLAYQVFFDAIAAYGKGLSSIPLDETPSLAPPLRILDHIQVLKEILAVYHSQGDGDDDEEGDREKERFTRVLDSLVDPAIEVIVERGKERKGEMWEGRVWVLNCLEGVLNVLAPFAFTMDKREEVKTVVGEHVDLLIEDHYTNIMKQCGLYEPHQVITTKSPDEPLSHHPSTTTPQLLAALNTFSTYLSSPRLLDPPPHLTIASGKIHHEALRRVVTSYETLCQEVKDPRNRYEAASTILGSERPWGQGRVLRQVFGLEED